MSLCPYGSVIQPPPLTQQQHRHHPIPLLRHPLLCRLTPLFLTPNHTLISSTTTTTTTTTTSVLHRDLGAELAAPDSDDAVSNPATELLDAPPQQNEEEEPAPQPQVTRFRKKKEEQQDNGDTFDNRYKLRNGREVLEEKAYLVGVERKGDDVEDSFGVQESLSELAQLADTVGCWLYSPEV